MLITLAAALELPTTRQTYLFLLTLLPPIKFELSLLLQPGHDLLNNCQGRGRGGGGAGRRRKMRNTVVAFCRTYLTTSSSRTSCTERVSLTFCQPACFAHSLNNSANRNRKETCYSPSVEDAIVQLYSSAATSTV